MAFKTPIAFQQLKFINNIGQRLLRLTSLTYQPQRMCIYIYTQKSNSGFSKNMDSPSKDIFNVLDEFIAAIEETKQVLQSPCVPGRTDACCLCECERPRRKKAIAKGPCDCELLQSRLMGSEDELHRYDNKYDQTVFINQHASREKEAEGLVTEMNSLLNQISTAANSLKKIYNRRSSPVIEDIWWISCLANGFLLLRGFWSENAVCCRWLYF